MIGMKDDGAGRRSGGRGQQSSWGRGLDWVLTCDHLATPGSCWPPPPALPQRPLGLTERSRLLLKTHRHRCLQRTHRHIHTNTHSSRKQGNNITAVSGGAPNSTRQRGGWRDGVPSRCCHGNYSGWRTADFLYSCGAQRKREKGTWDFFFSIK